MCHLFQSFLEQVQKYEQKRKGYEAASAPARDSDLQQQLDDLGALSAGIIRLLVAKQRDLHGAMEKTLKVERVLLTQRDVDGKLKECKEHTVKMEHLVRQMKPLENADAELLNFEVGSPRCGAFNPFTPKLKKYILLTF